MICRWLKRFLVREIAGCFGFNLVLRRYADALEICVKVVRIEKAEFAARLIHGDYAPHHHLAEVRQGEAEIVCGFLRVEKFFV